MNKSVVWPEVFFSPYIATCVVCGTPFQRSNELKQTCSEGCQREKDEADAEGFADIFGDVSI